MKNYHFYKNLLAASDAYNKTDHAFDLILPKISPSAHNAIYDVERFLALQIKNVEKPKGINLTFGQNEMTPKQTWHPLKDAVAFFNTIIETI